MPFDVTITNLSTLMEEKSRSREADMRAILENRSSATDIHNKNAFFRRVRDWTEIDMTQAGNHLDDENDLHGGTIIFNR